MLIDIMCNFKSVFTGLITEMLLNDRSKDLQARAAVTYRLKIGRGDSVIR